VNDPRKINWRWIGESLLMLLAISILPVIIGILLDIRLQTTPVFTLAMMFLGFNAGIVIIYRRIAVIYMQISPPAPEGNTEHPGGDSC
jgi:F0F1-type ATP synthase assembly protein I